MLRGQPPDGTHGCSKLRMGGMGVVYCPQCWSRRETLPAALSEELSSDLNSSSYMIEQGYISFQNTLCPPPVSILFLHPLFQFGPPTSHPNSTSLLKLQTPSHLFPLHDTRHFLKTPSTLAKVLDFFWTLDHAPTSQPQPSEWTSYQIPLEQAALSWPEPSQHPDQVI